MITTKIAASSPPLVAFATCAEHPDLHEDDRLALPHLAELGVDVEPAIWDDPAVDWGRFDLVVLRSPWDYLWKADEFVAWVSSLPRVANPADVIRWNVDKRYLADLADAGLPVVPTTFVAPGEAPPPVDGETVVKPTVSNGSQDTAVLADDDAVAELVARIHATGRTAMLQPYLHGVDEHGETALVFLGGALSHVGRKAALLRGADLEQVLPSSASPEELDLARAALAAVPTDEPLLYGRIDLVPGPDGSPVVLEVEVTEPSLFLSLDDGAPARLASAIARRVVGSA